MTEPDRPGSNPVWLEKRRRSRLTVHARRGADCVHAVTCDPAVAEAAAVGLEGEARDTLLSFTIGVLPSSAPRSTPTSTVRRCRSFMSINDDRKHDEGAEARAIFDLAAA